MSDRRLAETAGRAAEDRGAAWLEAAGWTILGRRVRSPAGEIDLVARRPGMVAFVEVKLRATAAGLDLALDERRLARVAACAEAVAHRFIQPGDDMRVDALLMTPAGPVRHLENVWLG